MAGKNRHHQLFANTLYVGYAACNEILIKRKITAEKLTITKLYLYVIVSVHDTARWDVIMYKTV